MTKGQTILLTGGALAAVGIIYFGFVKKYENGLTWYQDITSGNGGDSTNNTDTTGNPKGNPQVLPPVQSKFAGKRVSDVLLNTEDSKVKGLKVYSVADNVPVSNTNLTPYTIAKKGQLLGTFSSSKVTSAGGVLVQIYTGKTPSYLLAGAVNLKF